MKTPQRRFVVEFKSGRRLPKSQAISIWGDTDLKALAREVEDQSSHLFGTAGTVVNEVTDPAPDTDASILAGEPMMEDATSKPPTKPISVDSPGLIPAVLEEVAEPAPTPIAPPPASNIDEIAEPALSSIEPPTESRTVKTSKKAPRKRVARVLPVVVAIEKDEPQVPPVSAALTSPDDLAALDAENKRLRHLLANQLRAQNAELKRMLERF